MRPTVDPGLAIAFRLGSYPEPAIMFQPKVGRMAASYMGYCDAWIDQKKARQKPGIFRLD